MEIPDFKNTQEAIEYGKGIVHNPMQIKRLQEARDEILSKTKKIRDLPKVTDTQLQEGMDLAVKAQLLREAVEEAKKLNHLHLSYGKRTIDFPAIVDFLVKDLPEINVVDKTELIKGLEIEQEHTDVIGNNVINLAKIALAHLREIPDYYTRLIKMEREAKEQLK